MDPPPSPFTPEYYPNGVALHRPQSEHGTATFDVDNIVQQRLHVLHQFVRELRSEITERQALSRGLARELVEEECTVRTQILALEDSIPGDAPALTTLRLSLEQRLAELARQQRQDTVLCFRDIVDLSRELRTWVRQYSELRLRLALLGNAPQPTRDEVLRNGFKQA